MYFRERKGLHIRRSLQRQSLRSWAGLNSLGVSFGNLKSYWNEYRDWVLLFRCGLWGSRDTAGDAKYHPGSSSDADRRLQDPDDEGGGNELYEYGGHSLEWQLTGDVGGGLEYAGGHGRKQQPGGASGCSVEGADPTDREGVAGDAGDGCFRI